MTSKIRLLLVDDEEDFRTPITAILRSHDMEVQEAGSAVQMDNILQQFTPDIVVLDVNLPGENGFDIVHRLKQKGDLKIVMLTAYGGVEDRIEGLSRGADYYLPKPVDIRELLAVIQNLQPRRTSETETPWSLNTTTWILTTPDRAQHDLTKSELQILSTLANSHGEAVTRQQLYTALGIPDYSPETRSLDIQISRVRRRFTTENYTIPIKTVHGIGYLFGEPIAVKK